MIYSHKPQRSGRSITSNTNNPPQDPPPKIVHEPIPDTIIPKIPDTIIPKIPDTIIPDILIEDSTPPVPEICIEEKLLIESPKPAKKIISKKVIPKKTTLPKKTIPKPVSTQAEIIIPKISLFKRFITKIKSLFGRN